MRLYILTDANMSDICLEWNDKNLIKSPETKDSTVMNESIGACTKRIYMYVNKIPFFFFPFSAKVIFIFRSQYIFYSSYTKRLHIQNTWGFRTILSFIRAMCFFISSPPLFLSSFYISTFPRIYNVVATYDIPSGVTLSFSRSRTSKKLHLRCDWL